MNTRDHGGPAFPVQDCSKWQCHGLTIRDHFAASIIAGLYAGYGGNPPEPEQMAEDAYAIADAMLEARKS